MSNQPITVQPTLTLVQFLFARIAEDEAAAERGGWHNGPGTFANDNYGCLLIQPTRVLADCEAKRRIVEHYQQCVTAAESDAWRKNRISRERATSWVTALEPVLHMLALPYADHPDYNPDWRP